MLEKAFSFDRIDTIQVVLAHSWISVADKILVHPSPDWTFPDIVVSLVMKSDDLYWKALDYTADKKDAYPPVEVQVIRYGAPNIVINDGTITSIFERNVEVLGRLSCQEFKDMFTGELVSEEHLHSNSVAMREERLIKERLERLLKIEKNKPSLTRFRNLLED